MRPSLARARNVSEGGMYISVPGAVSVGAEVSCEVSIDGVRHSMRARVAWVHRDGPDRPAAIGLAFCALEEDQAAALRSLVTTAPPPDRSRVWFDGITESIVGRTEHFEGGAVLRAALPFLELGRHVRIEAGDGEPRTRAGRIANLALATEPDTKVPYLRVEFALDEEQAREAHEAHETREMREADDDLDVEIVVEADDETPPAYNVTDAHDMTGMPDMHGTHDMSGMTDMHGAHDMTAMPDMPGVHDMSGMTAMPDMRQWRRAMMVTGALVGVSCIVLAARLASPRTNSSVLATRVATPAHVSAPVLPAPPPPTISAQLPAPAVAATPEVAAETPEVAAETPEVAAEKTPLPAAAAATAVPQIRIGDTTEIEIPLTGTTVDEAHYVLDEPPGLAINLPSAHIAFPFGDTQVGKGGVRFVRVSRRQGGVQVRLHFIGETVPHYDVRVGTDRVRISVRPND